MADDERLTDPEQLAVLVERFGSDAAVAEVLGVSRSTVTRWRNRHGIDAAFAEHSPDVAAESKRVLRDAAALGALFAEHSTVTAVADRLRVSQPTVREWRDRHGIEHGRTQGRPRVGDERLETPEGLIGLLTEEDGIDGAAEASGSSRGTVKRRMRTHRVGWSASKGAYRLDGAAASS